ncbi:MAG TPA: lipopolysaccharide heptosyltransferase II, partial [Methylomirabilota bacterium]|nr:lipopolysaccharide heptosyltransferase II [Methylomirabilota bacterium]
WREQLRLIRGLRSDAATLALLLPNSFQSALIAWLSRSRWRVGYRSDGRSLLLTHPVPPPPLLMHQVDAYLRLVQSIGIAAHERTPRFTVTKDELARADRLLGSLGIDPASPLVGIQLGAAFGPSKRWIPERIAELAERLSKEGDGEPLLLGSREEEPLARWIAERVSAPLHSLVGKENPECLPAILSRCRAVVSADTGPAHLAAAVGTPVVTLFGPTDPRRSRPLGERQVVLWTQVPCSPCFLPRCPIDHPCMTSITTQQALTSVTESIQGSDREERALGDVK